MAARAGLTSEPERQIRLGRSPRPLQPPVSGVGRSLAACARSAVRSGLVRELLSLSPPTLPPLPPRPPLRAAPRGAARRGLPSPPSPRLLPSSRPLPPPPPPLRAALRLPSRRSHLSPPSSLSSGLPRLLVKNQPPTPVSSPPPVAAEAARKGQRSGSKLPSAASASGSARRLLARGSAAPRGRGLESQLAPRARACRARRQKRAVSPPFAGRSPPASPGARAFPPGPQPGPSRERCAGAPARPCRPVPRPPPAGHAAPGPPPGSGGGGGEADFNHCHFI